MTTATPPKDEWTSSDLDALPEDGVRREIFDGVLHVTPSPSPTHQTLAALLLVGLTQSCPEHLFVSQAVDVELTPKRVLVPDLLVTTLAAARTKRKFAASDLLLAAEIISPSTRSIDSVTKPFFYAAAGIPFYWLIDTSGELTIMTFERDPVDKAYKPTATFAGDDVIRLDQPWRIEIPLAAVRPRSL